MNPQPNHEKSKLAAILAIDVVGYSRLMRQDEARTLTELKSVRTEVIDPAALTYRGRVFKTMGDGFLLEFDSISNAVQYAIDVQKQMVQRVSARNDDQSFELRIGLNVADIIPDQDDVYGDGVNVAVRLEALAEASGICISGAVYEQIRATFGDTFKRMGPRMLKNIDTPVEVYAANFAPATPHWMDWLAKLPGSRRNQTIVASALLLVAVVFTLSQVGYAPAMLVTQDAASAIESRLDEKSAADAEAEVAKAEANAEAAKLEAGTTIVEAEAKAEVVQRAVDAWKEASLSLTETNKKLSDAESQLAEVQGRLAALKETAKSATETSRREDTLTKKIQEAKENLSRIMVSHNAAVESEARARAHGRCQSKRRSGQRLALQSL